MAFVMTFVSVEWLPRPGSWEEAVDPYQTPTAPDILADVVMSDHEAGSPQGEGE
jgi:hypothetical protein